MNTVRTLPIRVAPIAGEALDSWLEAYAHRTHTAFGDMLSATGLTPRPGLRTSGWIVHLTPDQRDSIAFASGVTAAQLDMMTIDHYAGRAVRVNPDSATLSRAFPWGRGNGSRFCPLCLAETGGRWQLAWRLGWTFACLRHRCLLADTCPQCGAVQRRRPHVSELIPQPGRCAHPATDAVGRIPQRCGANLADAPVVCFHADHVVLRAQELANTVVDTDVPAFGIYEPWPQPRIKVLADIRAIAGRTLAYATPADFESVIPADLHDAYRLNPERAPAWSGARRAVTKPGLAAPTTAATAAVGVVVALKALGSKDIAAAGDELRWLVTTARDRGLNVCPANIGWGKGISPILTGAQISAVGPMLNPSDQVRYRIGSPLPTHPHRGTSHTAQLARRLPTMLWPGWSLPLSIQGCHQQQLRPALSIILLLVGSRLSLDAAARLIESPIEGHAVSRVLQLLEQQETWSNIRAALVRMDEYLAAQHVPIDYKRRRRLDWNTLMPDKVWAQICRDTATPGPVSARAKIARCFLFERLSGLPASVSPWGNTTAPFRTHVADFPQYLNPELARALDDYAGIFLADNGIGQEPATWYPPTELLCGLELPGSDPEAVDLSDLHRISTVGVGAMGTAAKQLEITLDAVRYLLERHPAPRPAPPPGSTPHNRAYYSAKIALPRERLVDLYEQRRISLRDIASMVGVSRQIVARLAHDYDLPLRDPCRTAQVLVDRDWLYAQYVTQRRALPDIAREAGMSTANMARWAKKHDIPMRGRGTASHSATLAAQGTATDAPELIRPALAGSGGWQRLQRFAAATNHPTLTVAAKSLGLHQGILTSQINRVEKELGMALLIRAERGRPMEITDAGARVLAAIRAWRPADQQ
ncbi:TniQ family protein [Mycobacterium aquaticum]|uniref:Uncharacterized protein n=1 Tax=Mycobacterium aquaticum TaxID=1927124 RepID=A0A1X0B0X5_9MYCO|nr:TniQ family protein [Mycobacterium aquaticum]ORA35982.1 hypothetical protein BST13_12675 [Mycobacterium aquaticum]